MKMELLENGCLKIVLSDEELRDMGLSFEKLDYRNLETQRAIQQLLLTAARKPVSRHNGDLTVEAIPLENGCLLLLTPTFARRRIRMKRRSALHIPDFGRRRPVPAGGKLEPPAETEQRHGAARLRRGQFPLWPGKCLWAGAVSRRPASAGSEHAAAGIRPAAGGRGRRRSLCRRTRTPPAHRRRPPPPVESHGGGAPRFLSPKRLKAPGAAGREPGLPPPR